MPATMPAHRSLEFFTCVSCGMLTAFSSVRLRHTSEAAGVDVDAVELLVSLLLPPVFDGVGSDTSMTSDWLQKPPLAVVDDDDDDEGAHVDALQPLELLLLLPPPLWLLHSDMALDELASSGDECDGDIIIIW